MAPVMRTALAVAMRVRSGTITSSPGPIVLRHQRRERYRRGAAGDLGRRAHRRVARSAPRAPPGSTDIVVDEEIAVDRSRQARELAAGHLRPEPRQPLGHATVPAHFFSLSSSERGGEAESVKVETNGREARITTPPSTLRTKSIGRRGRGPAIAGTYGWSSAARPRLGRIVPDLATPPHNI